MIGLSLRVKIRLLIWERDSGGFLTREVYWNLKLAHSLTIIGSLETSFGKKLQAWTRWKVWMEEQDFDTNLHPEIIEQVQRKSGQCMSDKYGSISMIYFDPHKIAITSC